MGIYRPFKTGKPSLGKGGFLESILKVKRLLDPGQGGQTILLGSKNFTPRKIWFCRSEKNSILNRKAEYSDTKQRKDESRKQNFCAKKKNWQHIFLNLENIGSKLKIFFRTLNGLRHTLIE